MSKDKVRNLEYSVHVEHDGHTAVRNKNPSVKVSLYEDAFHKELIGSFYIPTTTYSLGWKKFDEAVRARAKHDFNIIWNHYTLSPR